MGQNAGADLRRHRARVLVDAVARGHVADLVAEHGGEFGLVLDVGHDAAGDVDIAARQREGIDLVAVEHRESVLKVRAVALLRQPFADALHVGLQLGVVVDAVLLANFRVVLATERNLLGLGHEHEVGCATHRVGDAARQPQEQQYRSQQTENAGNQGHYSGDVSMAGWVRRRRSLPSYVLAQPRATILSPISVCGVA